MRTRRAFQRGGGPPGRLPKDGRPGHIRSPDPVEEPARLRVRQVARPLGDRLHPVEQPLFSLPRRRPFRAGNGRRTRLGGLGDGLDLRFLFGLHDFGLLLAALVVGGGRREEEAVPFGSGRPSGFRRVRQGGSGGNGLPTTRGLRPSLRHACRERQQPVRHLRQPRTAMLERPLPEYLPGSVGNAHLMLLRTSVGTDEPSCLQREPPRLANRTGAPSMPTGPCTGALRRKLPTGHPPMAGCRGTSPQEVLDARGDSWALRPGLDGVSRPSTTPTGRGRPRDSGWRAGAHGARGLREGDGGPPRTGGGRAARPGPTPTPTFGPGARRVPQPAPLRSEPPGGLVPATEHVAA